MIVDDQTGPEPWRTGTEQHKQAEMLPYMQTQEEAVHAGEDLALVQIYHPSLRNGTLSLALTVLEVTIA